MGSLCVFSEKLDVKILTVKSTDELNVGENFFYIISGQVITARVDVFYKYPCLIYLIVAKCFLQH